MRYLWLWLSNLWTRNKQQDKFIIEENKWHEFFWVLDWHWADDVVDFVQKELVRVFLDNRKLYKDATVEQLFQETFLSLNQEIMLKWLSWWTTASILYIDPDNNKWLWFVGDSPVFTYWEKWIIPLTKFDHNIRNIKLNWELKRLMRYFNWKDIQALLKTWYLWEVNLTRSLWDVNSIEYWVSYMPEVIKLWQQFSKFLICTDWLNDFFDPWLINYHMYNDVWLFIDAVWNHFCKVVKSSFENEPDSDSVNLDNVSILVVEDKKII